MAGMPNQGRPVKPSIAETHTGDIPLDEVQRRLREALALIGRIPFLVNGRMISCRFPVANTDYFFEHGLGSPAACFVVRQSYEGIAHMSISESATAVQAQVPQDRVLGLRSNAAGTVDVWFYVRASKNIDRNKTPQQSR